MTTAAGMAAPIACSLAPGAYGARVRWIGDLNRTALHAHRRDSLTLTLSYAPEALPRVHDLVARERACCGFLEFRVVEAVGEVRLTITAPETVREVSDAVFAPFLSGVIDTTPEDGACDGRQCGCSSTKPAPIQRGGVAAAVSSGARRAPGVAAAAAATTALACGVCCVVPLALPSLALTAFGGVVAAFAGAYRWAVDVALVLTLCAWGLLAWQSVRTRRAPGIPALRLMSAATVVMLAALAWPLLEPIVRGVLHA